MITAQNPQQLGYENNNWRENSEKQPERKILNISET